MLHRCDAGGAAGAYDRLREELRKTSIAFGNGASRALAVSGGLATMESANDFRSDDLVARADAALYRAKHEGRDWLEVEAAVEPEPS